jgi:mannitol/fructose-specific phosphotransferase system IIA component (Ntr-type)
MHPVVNHLIQLQELTMVRAEQKAAGREEALETLDSSILTLTEALAEEMRQAVAQLQKRDALFIVPVANGVCAGCGMQLPTSLVQAVRLAHQVYRCPICTRILYHPVAGLHRAAATIPSRLAPRKIGIQRFSDLSLMCPRLDATDRDEAIREMAQLLCEKGFANDPTRLAEAAIQREAIVSTAVEHGLAFPHVRGVEGGGLTLALGLSRKGIRFGSGRTLTRIIFFMTIPTAASAFYLKLLAGLTSVFQDAEARRALMAETTAEGLWKTLNRLTRPTIP